MDKVFEAFGKRLALRPMTEEDCGLIVDWRNNDRVRLNYIYREPFTIEGQLKYYKSQVLTGKVFHYMVCVIEENMRPIGCSVFKNYDPENKEIEYGLFLGADDIIGKGYGKETTQLSCKFGFSRFHADRIYGTIMADNDSSLISNTKAGMVKERILKDVECSDGVKRDMVLVAAYPENFRDVEIMMNVQN